MRNTRLFIAGTLVISSVGTMLWVAPASALDKCTATLRLSDGAILIGAKRVSGTLLWGNSAGTETNAFNNAFTCVAGSPLVAKKCQLGATGSALAITPPPLCTLYLKDGAGTCSARIAKCTPGTRPLVELPSRFVDNGDGTLTDTQTGLMWEQKTGTPGGFVDCATTTCSNPEDVNNAYAWCIGSPNCTNASNPPDGPVFTDFLPRVNGTLCSASSCTGLGGHSDWRLPTMAELQSIPLAPYPCGTSPCIDTSFGPTQSNGYWSATTYADGPIYAWGINFSGGGGSGGGNILTKASAFFGRAVRSGL